MKVKTGDASTRLFAVLLLTALVVTVLCATARVAKAADQAPSIVVKFDDLNLQTQAGAMTLYHRISTAASEVCPHVDGRVLSEYAFVKACRRGAISRAVDQVGSAELAALLKSARVASLR